MTMRTLLKSLPLVIGLVFVPLSSVYAENRCCQLIGKGTACSLHTSFLAQVCGEQIDKATAYGSRERSHLLQECMAEAAAYSGKQYSRQECKSIEERIYRMSGGGQ